MKEKTLEGDQPTKAEISRDSHDRPLRVPSFFCAKKTFSGRGFKPVSLPSFENEKQTFLMIVNELLNGR